MGKIRLLEDHVINQIAAGEVVQRPVSVVKELLENSLDAGAKRIQIGFEAAGKRRIYVQDDGEGMSPEDAQLALRRHATSKLRSAEDLLRIGSLGFRGEALASIASVARFTLRTRRPEDLEGTQLYTQGGAIPRAVACGMAPGTQIQVDDLFYCVPARAKFLKSDRTETSHIMECVRAYALAHPHVGFVLQEGAREIFSLPAVRSFEDRLYTLYSLQEPLLHVSAMGFNLQIQGLISPPGLGHPNGSYMLILLNGRPVESVPLLQAAREAYRGHLPEKHYPMLFLRLQIDPSEVDVNVHPEKRQVRFRSQLQVQNLVQDALATALQEAQAKAAARWGMVGAAPLSESSPSCSLVCEASGASAWSGPVLAKGGPFQKPRLEEEQAPSAASEPILQEEGIGEEEVPACSRALEAAGAGLQPVLISSGGAAEVGAQDKPPFAGQASPLGSALPRENPHSPSSNSAFIKKLPPFFQPSPGGQPSLQGQRDAQQQSPGLEGSGWAFQSLLAPHYALFTEGAGVIVLNLKAAWARVVCETLEGKSPQYPEPVGSQPLLVPEHLSLSATQVEVLEGIQPFLTRNGWVIEPFGKGFFRILAQPAWLEQAAGRSLLESLLAECPREAFHAKREVLLQSELAGLVAQFRLREVQTPEGVAKLVKQLFQCRQPLTCPKGRPTYFYMAPHDIRARLRD